MKKQLGSVLSMTLVALASAGVMRVVGFPGASSPATAPTPESELAAGARATAGRLDRELSRAGSQLGAAALVRSAAAASAPEQEGTPTGDALEAEQARETAAREARTYDGFDALVDAGGGATGLEQLRRNIQAAKNITGKLAPAPLDGAAVTCGETICRVKLRLADVGQVLDTAHVLGQGMSGLSMRPLDRGQAVFYLGAPGHPLPPIER